MNSVPQLQWTSISFGLFKDINSIYGNFDLQVTRDCHVHTSKSIIKSIEQAQTDAYNQGIYDALELVYKNGKIYRDETFSEIRKTAKSYLYPVVYKAKK